MNTELALLLLKKLNIPHSTKFGLLTALLVFKVFDIDGVVKRAMASKTSA